MNIPFEVFTVLIGVFLAVGVIGLWKKAPVLLIIVGSIIALLGIMTDNFVLGQSPTNSTVSGSTTTYVFTDRSYTLDAWNKIFICLVGVVLCIVGGLEAHRENNILEQ